MTSMVNKTGYKKTKLGWIPEDWNTIKLNKLIEKLESGVSIGGEDRLIRKGELGVLKVSAVSYGVFDPTEVKVVSKENEKRLKALPKEGSILISRANTPELVGATAFVYKSYNNVFLPDKLWQTIFNSQVKIEPLFVFYSLKTDSNKYRISKLATGSSGSMKNISKPSFLSLTIAMPSLLEQQKIATILSTWDKAIDKLSALIDAKEEQKKGLMQRLLTGKVRLKGFHQVWRTMKLGEVFEERRETGNTGLELLSIGSKGVYPQSESNKKDTSNNNKDKYKRICKGDIGYNTMRMWQGRSAISTLEGIVSPAYTIVTPKEGHHVRFYGYLFHTPDLIHRFWRYSQGLVGDTLNCKFKSFSKVKALVPPTVEEQEQIASVLDQISREIKTLEKKRDIFELEKKGLMQQLLTGKTRVKVN